MTADDDSLLGAFLAKHAGFAGETLFAPGAEVGEWVVSGFIGRGGTSEVYCVRNRASGAPAALKVLCRTEAHCKARFARETEFVAANACDSLPRFYGKGVASAHPYFVMELLEPLELPKGEAEIARFICAVAKAAAWLHRRGFVHRDIKPRNVLWRKESTNGRSRPVLVDFGLVKEISRGNAFADTELSIVDGKAVGVGTPRYAAPEQFTGAEATPAMDIHALGRLAYECFDGKPPRAWSRIIRRATSSIPDERYRTVDDFVGAVSRRNLLRNLAAAALTAVALAAACAGWLAAGGPESLKWRLMRECVCSTNVMQLAVHGRTFATNDRRGQKVVLPAETLYKRTTNSVAAAIVRLNGATNVFEHPLELEPGRELWLVGPGALDAEFVRSEGAVVRLAGCTLRNRTRETMQAAGVRYVLYRGAILEFSQITRDEGRENGFLAMSTLNFPDDDTVRWKDAVPAVDPSVATVKYRKTDEDFNHELAVEKAIIRARLASELRDARDFED